MTTKKQRVLDLAPTHTVEQIAARLNMTNRHINAILRAAGVEAKGKLFMTDPRKRERDRLRKVEKR